MGQYNSRHVLKHVTLHIVKVILRFSCEKMCHDKFSGVIFRDFSKKWEYLGSKYDTSYYIPTGECPNCDRNARYCQRSVTFDSVRASDDPMNSPSFIIVHTRQFPHTYIRQ